jgi:glucose/arabinose dehydrogenase
MRGGATGLHAVSAGFALFFLSSIANTAGGADADSRLGQHLFEQQCQLCHGAAGGGGLGPNLEGIVGRRSGAAAFGYSQAMQHTDLVWTGELLGRYLANPAALVRGTSMVVRVGDEQARRDLIAYLATLRNGPMATAASTRVVPPPGRPGGLLAGHAAFGDWQTDAPGVRRRITVADLPQPFATPSSGNSPRVISRPAGAALHVPDGFRVDLFADGLENPRLLRVAPNGDVFVAETASGRIRVLRQTDGKVIQRQVYADGLDAPFGIAFYPPGPNPEFIYIAENNAILRIPYRNGDIRARTKPETVVPRLTAGNGGHSTRDIVFSPDGARMFVSVGSATNVATGMGEKRGDALQAWTSTHALGAAWGNEENRAAVLAFSPDGTHGTVFATGLRNCVGMAVQPGSGALWCSTNERDGLGDDLVPDYITRVREGGFYGWPWTYLGDHEDPRLRGQRPDLKGRATVPDVLIQPHSASLQMAFYDGTAFPAAYRGFFASEHGSWNRSKRTGYKVVRVILDARGNPTGEYEDFLTGFVANDSAVWGRPVGVAVDRDGALLVSEDANGTIWRVSYVAK